MRLVASESILNTQYYSTTRAPVPVTAQRVCSVTPLSSKVRSRRPPVDWTGWCGVHEGRERWVIDVREREDSKRFESNCGWLEQLLPWVDWKLTVNFSTHFNRLNAITYCVEDSSYCTSSWQHIVTLICRLAASSAFLVTTNSVYLVRFNSRDPITNSDSYIRPKYVIQVGELPVCTVKCTVKSKHETFIFLH